MGLVFFRGWVETSPKEDAEDKIKSLFGKGDLHLETKELVLCDFCSNVGDTCGMHSHHTNAKAGRIVGKEHEGKNGYCIRFKMKWSAIEAFSKVWF